jgi:ProP effector
MNHILPTSTENAELEFPSAQPDASVAHLDNIGNDTHPAASKRPPKEVVFAALEKAAELYPHLFGSLFVPVKRGIFQDLLAAHPEVFDKEILKAALALHTRSTRYLNAVAAGQPRHDLQNQVVEAMAPEHIYLALQEIFRRRQSRSEQDLRPQLCNRIAQAFTASGLSAQDYRECVWGRDEQANMLLDEAIMQAEARMAKNEALRNAFQTSGQSVENFADMYGLDSRAVAQMLASTKRTAPA